MTSKLVCLARHDCPVRLYGARAFNQLGTQESLDIIFLGQLSWRACVSCLLSTTFVWQSRVRWKREDWKVKTLFGEQFRKTGQAQQQMAKEASHKRMRPDANSGLAQHQPQWLVCLLSSASCPDTDRFCIVSLTFEGHSGFERGFIRFHLVLLSAIRFLRVLKSSGRFVSVDRWHCHRSNWWRIVKEWSDQIGLPEPKEKKRERASLTRFSKNGSNLFVGDKTFAFMCVGWRVSWFALTPFSFCLSLPFLEFNTPNYQIDQSQWSSPWPRTAAT